MNGEPPHFLLTLPELRRMYELDRMIAPGRRLSSEFSGELNNLLIKQAPIGTPLAHILMRELIAARERLELLEAGEGEAESPW